MAGIISPSMPVFIVDNAAFGNRAYATQNEGLGRGLRYGAYGPEVLQRLKWMEAVLYPALAAALERIGPLDLRALLAQALHMGDEGHNRNRAGTSLFLRAIAPALVEAVADRATVAQVLRFIDSNDHFFLNLSMAAGKTSLDAAHGVPGSTVVTTMARNGKVRYPGQRPGRYVVHGPGRPARGPVLPQLHRRRREPGHRRQHSDRDGRLRRVRSGRRAGHRPVRGRDPGRRSPRHPGDVRDHRGRERALHHPGLRTR